MSLAESETSSISKEVGILIFVDNGQLDLGVFRSGHRTWHTSEIQAYLINNVTPTGLTALPTTR